MADSKTKSKMSEDDCGLPMITFVKAFLQKDESEAPAMDSNSLSFFPLLILQVVRLRIAEPGRLVCSMTVPRQLVDGDNRLHVGAIATMADVVGATVVFTVGAPASGVSLEINISCFDAAYLDMAGGRLKTVEDDELNSLKTFLESGERRSAAAYSSTPDFNADALPLKFFERFIVHDLRLHFIETGRIICSIKVHPRLLSANNRLHGGATAMLVDVLGSAVVYTFGYGATGVSVEISVSFFDTAHLDEEIEIEAKALRVGKTMAAVTVEFRRKSTGKEIAQGRHTKYIAPGAAPTSSKL